MKELTYHDFLANFGIGGAHPGGLSMTREIVKREAIQKSTRLLDVGCGTGQTSAYLSREYGCRLTAIDRHPLMLEKAKKRFQREKVNVKLVQGDVHQLPFADQSFDLLLVESVTIFTDLSESLSEYARVLRKGGVLLDLEMTSERPLSAKELEELSAVYGTKWVPTETEWRGRLQRAGFDPIEVVTGGTVASAISGPGAQQGEMPEFDPSESLDPRLYEIWTAHQLITEKFSRRLGYRVYRALVK